jgi:hypothetical protein
VYEPYVAEVAPIANGELALRFTEVVAPEPTNFVKPESVVEPYVTDEVPIAKVSAFCEPVKFAVAARLVSELFVIVPRTLVNVEVVVGVTPYEYVP